MSMESCELCGGETLALGVLGARTITRCRSCGDTVGDVEPRVVNESQRERVDAKFGGEIPVLSPVDRERYRKIDERLMRANSRLRTALKNGDIDNIGARTASRDRAAVERDAFVAGFVADLRAPALIVYESRSHWADGLRHGMHVIRVAMRLDHVDIVGPRYRLIGVESDVGGPPTMARGAPKSFGVAWSALDEYVRNGLITVIEVSS